MIATSILKVSTHRGAPRVWIEGRSAQRAGFEPSSTYQIQKRKDCVILNLDDTGRTVSKKSRRGRVIPIIDLNGSDTLSPVAGAEVVKVVFHENRIVISKVASHQRMIERLKRLKQKLQTGEALSTGGIAAGAGVLTYASHEGLTSSGLNVRVKLHNEMREDLSEVAIEQNSAMDEDTMVLNMPLQELAFDDETLAEVGPVDILELCLPCSGASSSGASKLGLSMAEQHPDVGHLVVGALALIAKLNPICCVFENVPNYQKTASAVLIRQQLRDLGYETQERLLSGPDFGSVEKRKRWCLVAMTRGIDFDIEAVRPIVHQRVPIGTMFDAPDLVEDRWSEMKGLKAKQMRDIEAGKGFRMQVYNGDELSINTLTKGMTRNRSTDPKIAHPTNPDLLRIPTAREHARFKGIPAGLIEGLSETTAHELLGQSIVTAPFVALFKHIGESIRAWSGEITNTAGQLSLKLAA